MLSDSELAIEIALATEGVAKLARAAGVASKKRQSLKKIFLRLGGQFLRR